MKKIKYTVYIVSLLLISLVSCESMMDIKPENQLLEDEALQTEADLQALLNSAYSQLTHFMGGTWQRYSDLMADDFVPNSETNKRQQIYNRTTSAYFTANDAYDNAYVGIHRCNKVIQMTDVISMSDASKQRMINEARFLRAYNHFNLVRMFAQPYNSSIDNSHAGIVIKDNIEATIQMSRSSVADVYSFILSDLNDASALPNENGNYATSWAAKALLAEVYFQMGDYDNAFTTANDVIANGAYTFETDFAESVDMTVGAINTEVIFKLVSEDGVSNAGGGFGVYRSDGDNVPSIRVSKDLYRLATLNPSDFRSAWYSVVNEGEAAEYYAIAKFNVDYSDVPLLYITPLKLLRAESAVLMTTPDLTTAIADANDVIERAMGGTSANLAGDADAATILSTVRSQKRFQLVGEGYRVHDLKRIGANEDASLLIRGVPWNCPGLALQFPSSELAKGFEFNEEGGC